MPPRSMVCILSLLLGTGCSLRKAALDRVGDALAQGGGTFASDPDPDLVRDATPFALKTVESLLDARPRHPGLLLAAASGFAQYARAFVQDEADYAEAGDPARAAHLRRRAKALHLRARAYGLRGLDVALPGFSAGLATDPDRTLARAGRAQVPLLYWTAAAWASAFSLDVSDAALASDQARIEGLLDRALALDPTWNGGALHAFRGAWEAAHLQAGGSAANARRSFQEALRLSGGLDAATHVALAESLDLEAQDRRAFEGHLREALAVDPDRDPARRVAILVAQKRARWLLTRMNDLFLDAPETPP